MDQYLEHIAVSSAPSTESSSKEGSTSSAAQLRQLKKDLTRVERQVAKGKERLAQLKLELEAAAFSPEKLLELTAEITTVECDLVAREEEWLEITLALES